MKCIPIILLGLLLASPCIAMPEHAIYIKGIDDGYYLGILAWQARGNATAAELYNAEVLKYNAWLKDTVNASEYELEALALLPMPDDSWMPPVVREWDGKSLWGNVPPSPALAPVLIANNTTSTGIVHAIDGGTTKGPHYTTNDINVLPDAAIAAYQRTEAGRLQGDGYLGGV